MFIAMNRFRVKLDRQEEFESVWTSRKTFLEEVPGFRVFHLLKGPHGDDHALYTSHSMWDSREAFEGWTKSEAFRQAHAGAADHRDLYQGPPQFEGFEVLQEVGAAS